MASLLFGSLAKQVDAAFKASGIPLTGTLKRPVATTVDANGDPVTTYTSYSFRGFIDNYSDVRRAQAGIPIGDRLANIFAASLSVEPKIGDYLTMTGYGWLKVRDVSTDPAKALWECQVFSVEEPGV